MSSSILEGHLDEPVMKHARADFIRVRAGQTVAQALADVQQSDFKGRIVYFYVVDEHDRLQGVLPTRRLLLNPPETPIADLMVRGVITLPTTATLFDACELFILHRLLAFPVVDDEGRIRGVVDVEVYTDEMSELARREESDDVFQLIGVRLAQVRRASVPAVFGRRFPWLLCNAGGGLACAFLTGLFTGVLGAELIVLSLFTPVVLAMAESVSIQSLTLTLQAQHGHRFRWADALESLRREVPTAVLLGLACGALVGSVALVWQRRPMVALTLLGGIGLAVITAALLGLLVPTVLRAVQRDPKVASGPIVLAMTDLATLTYYLGLAAWLLR